MSNITNTKENITDNMLGSCPTDCAVFTTVSADVDDIDDACAAANGSGKSGNISNFSAAQTVRTCVQVYAPKTNPKIFLIYITFFIWYNYIIKIFIGKIISNL